MKTFAIALCCSLLASISGFEREALGQTNLCDQVPQQGNCSFTSINGNCQINVDRANAISFPTIFMKPGSRLTVVVYNASPFETLTLDLTSLTAALRPDTFQTVFNSLTPNASKATGVTIHPFLATRATSGQPPPPSLDDLLTSERALLNRQNEEIDETDASLVLRQISLAVQGPTSQSCFLSTATTTDEFSNPWYETSQWKTAVETRLQIASQGTQKKEADLQADAQSILGQIAVTAHSIEQWNNNADPTKPNPIKLDPANQEKLKSANELLATLNSQQATLDAKIAARGDNGNANHESDRLSALAAAVSSIPVIPRAQTTPHNIVDQFVVTAPKSGGAFNVTGAWALNYTNALSPVVNQVSQATFTPTASPLAASYAQLGTGATKTQAMTVTIQSTYKEWVEASAGFVVPWRGYHSYSAAAQATAGTVVNNVVQETVTHTVVPSAFANMNLYELPSRRGSWAFFVTPFVGYNGTTSAVETGIGPSVSWRSIMLNFLADYASDTHLSGGFSVGQSLGPTNPASPLTKNSYSWRFAPGISIRIPLGGSTASPAAAGSTATSNSASSSPGAAGTSVKHH